MSRKKRALEIKMPRRKKGEEVKRKRENTVGGRGEKAEEGVRDK